MRTIVAIVAIVVIVVIVVIGMIPSSSSSESYSSPLPSPLDVEIIHLVLYSPSFPYENMRKATWPLYRKARPKIATLYYCFTPDLPTAFHLDHAEGILHIRGKETYVPGILDKTVDAIGYALQTYPNARLLVRSNASTVLDLPRMLDEVDRSSVQYGGCMLNTLAWLDAAGGVVDQTWWGTRYASGTCILMSRQVAEQLVAERDLLRRDLVDDLSIGVWMREHHPNLKIWESSSHHGSKKWLYRHRQESREKDVEAVQQCVSRLIAS